MTIGERIKQRRKQINMSAETLADKIGKSPATIYRYEKGEIDKVDSRLIPLIADALLVEPGYLMGWEETTYSPDRINGAVENDPDVVELVTIYHDLNPTGQTTLMNVARGLNANPDMKKAGASSSETA